MGGILDGGADGRRLARVAAMPEIELQRRDGVARLTLNAPERRNALTVEMAEALTAACEEIDADPSVGAVVVRGEGGCSARAATAARSPRRAATRRRTRATAA